jgi:hypothetical protein
MFQQALWIGGTDQEDKGQEVDLLKSMTGAGRERSSAPEHFPKDSSSYSDAKLLKTTREDSAFRLSTDSVCYWNRRRVVSRPLDEHPSRCRARGRRNRVMDKVWSINVKGPQGYQWWHVAYDAEADARIAIAKACPEAQIVEAMRASNAFQVKRWCVVSVSEHSPSE